MRLPFTLEQIVGAVAALLAAAGIVAALVTPFADGSSNTTSAQSTATTLPHPGDGEIPEPFPSSNGGTGPAVRRSDTQPSRDLIAVSERSWDRWERVEGKPNALRIFYWGGACSGEYVQVEETGEGVNVRLFTGAPKGGPDACIAIALSRSMVVTLDAPLGDRVVTQTVGAKPERRDIIPLPTVPVVEETQ